MIALILSTGARMIRLQNPDPVANGIMLTVIMIVVVIIFLSNTAFQKKNVNQRTRKKYNKYISRKTALNLGLESKHVKLMEQMVKQLKVTHPILLYSDRNKLDAFMKDAIYSIEQSGKTEAEQAALIKTIYEIKEIFDLHSRRSMGLRSTHLIKPDQDFLVLTQGGQKFHTKVVNNLSSAITCAPPQTRNQEKISIKRGTKLKVFFWRDNDSGYTFYSRVVGYDSKSKNSHFYIRHANKMIRAQNRKHRRKPIQASCFLYPVDLLGKDKKTKKQKINIHYDIRMLGNIKDISARGCRLISRHLFKKDQLLKIDFTINRRENISVIGKVKNISTQEGHGRSMSIVFSRISNKSRNLIYSYIFHQI